MQKTDKLQATYKAITEVFNATKGNPTKTNIKAIFNANNAPYGAQSTMMLAQIGLIKSENTRPAKHKWVGEAPTLSMATKFLNVCKDYVKNSATDRTKVNQSVAERITYNASNIQGVIKPDIQTQVRQLQDMYIKMTEAMKKLEDSINQLKTQ